MKFFNDFNEKWYFWGTVTGIMAGITLGVVVFEIVYASGRRTERIDAFLLISRYR